MMTVLGVAAVFLVAAIIMVIHQSAGRRARLQADQVLLKVAGRLSIPERLTESGGLAFERRGFPASVAVHVQTRLNVEVSFRLTGEEPGWITVSSLGVRRAFLEQIGFKDVQVGDGEFDERVDVWGSDQEDVRLRLKPDIRNLLTQVDRRWDFLWRLTPDQMVLRARILPIDPSQVETLTGMAFQILDLLEMISPADVTLSLVEERLDSETRCPVCGTPLSQGRIVRCSKCRGAHHADCWQFNGLCATFACGTKTNVK